MNIKKSFMKKSKKFRFLLCLSFVSVLATSCESFLDGSSLKKQLQDEIEYSKANEIEIQIQPASNQGTTTPSGTYKKKIGYSFDISFIEAEGYKFFNWSAVDAKTGTELTDAVEFVDSQTISTSVKILKNVSNIWIKPVAALIPKPVSENCSPKLMASGVVCDSPLVITFNTPMDKESLESFENIKIRGSVEKESIPFNEYYNNPVLSEDGKVLTIIPKSQVIAELLGADSFKNIYVYLENTAKTKSGDLLSLFYEDELSLLQTRINSNRESGVPVFTVLELKKFTGQDTSERITESTFSQLIDSIGPEGFFTDTYHCNAIEINCSGYDTDSGIASLAVKEKLLYSVDGLDVSGKNFEKTTVVDSPENGSGIYSFSGKYEFSKEFSDGIVELTVILTDRGGNISEKTFAVVKDTKVNVTYTNYFAKDAKPDVSPVESNKYFAVGNISKDLWATWNGVEYRDEVSFNKSLFLDKNKNELFEGLSVPDDTKSLFRFDGVDASKDSYIRLIFSDKAGNTDFHDKYICAAPIVVNYWSESGKIIASLSASGSFYEVYYGQTEDNISEKIEDDVIYFLGVPENSYACYRIKYDSSNMYGFFSKAYYFNKSYSEIENSIKSEDLTCTLTLNDDVRKNGLNLHVRINNDDFFNLDSTCIQFNYNYYPIYEKEADFNVDLITLLDIAAYQNYENPKMYVGLFAVDGEITVRSEYDWESGSGLPVEGQWFEIDLNDIIREINEVTDYCPPSVYTNRFFTTSKGRAGSDEYYHGYEPIVNHPSVEAIFGDSPNKTLDTLLNENGKIPVRLYWRKPAVNELSENEIKLLPYFDQEVSLDTDRPYGEVKNFAYIALDDIFAALKNEKTMAFECYVYLEDHAGNGVFHKFEYSQDNTKFNITYAVPAGKTEKKLTSVLVEDETEGFFAFAYAADEKNLDNEDQHRARSGNLFGPENWNGTGASNYILNNDFIILDKVYENEQEHCVYYFCTTEEKPAVKNLIQNNNLITVLSDKKSFVHTVASPVDFGTNIRLWESFTGQDYKFNEVVIKPEQTGNIFNNYEIPESEIPEGWYYTVIVYYGDNTSTISSVMKK